MKNMKKKTFVYKGLGFPVKLINAPMKKVYGEWYLDIDMNKLMLVVLGMLAHKSTALTGDEIRFIRTYLKMTAVEFGKIFNISHVAVVKWESNENKISPALDFYIRLYILDRVSAKDKEFRSLYQQLPLGQISKREKGAIHPLPVDVNSEALKIAL
jgi:DNA-binding transcriptional regulator YiaG